MLRISRTIIILAMTLLASLSAAQAQSSVIDFTLKPNQIVPIKTGERITTRIIFPGPVKEIICGDLYDPGSGKGSFVIQGGDKDIFVKPIVRKGVSNMFVKVGENGEYVYNFDLSIVPAEQAYRVINIIDAQAESTAEKENQRSRKPLLIPPSLETINLVNGASDEMPLELVRASFDEVALPPLPRNELMPESTNSVNSVTGATANVARKATKRVVPDYPQQARMTGAQGQVVVEVIVNGNGKVTSARVLSGHLLLRPAAIHAARLWRFTPADDSKEEVTKITFNFKGSDNQTEGYLLAPGALSGKREKRDSH